MESDVFRWAADGSEGLHEAVLHITAGIQREGAALGSPAFGRCSSGSQCYFYLLSTGATDKNEKLW